jgi:two-component system sensor histidine kinase/response regulator
MMPDMDGIEVCQRLQANEETRGIPVIFITARTNKESKLEGLERRRRRLHHEAHRSRRDPRARADAAPLRADQPSARRADPAAGGVAQGRTIGAVTQGIAHNLNNLLGVVIGYLDLVKAYYDKPEQVRKNVQHVEDAVGRIVSIIKQLSTLVVRSRPPFIKAGLQRLLEGGVARFHHDYRLTAPVTIENPLGDLMIDTNYEIVEEVLAKVLINAWESYPNRITDPRPVSMHTQIVEKPDDGKFVEIRIVDHGRGLDADIRDKIFEPFVSTKNTVGVGMGLTVARHALRNLGGEVTLVDRPGGGALCTIRHPLERKNKG